LDEADIEDDYNKDHPIITLIKSFASNNGIELEKGGKVGLAMAAKAQLKNKKADILPKEYIDKWTKLFNAFLSGQPIAF